MKFTTRKELTETVINDYNDSRTGKRAARKK